MDILSSLIAELPRHLPSNKPGECTSCVRAALRAIAQTHGLDLYPDKTAEHGQFIVDFVIYRRPEGDSPGYIELAIESELSTTHPKSIWHDFDKLMHIKAAVKAMIYRARNDQARQGILKRYLHRYRDFLAMETYLIIEYWDDGPRWFRCVAAGNAAGKSIQFEQI